MLQRAQQILKYINDASSVHIVTHIDADGITAGAIAIQTLKRMKKPYTIECVKQLDDIVMKKLEQENHDLVWFTDLGSSMSTKYPKINKIITDHHTCPDNADFPFHLNPHLFQIDGTFEISGAGTTYLVAKASDKKNTDLAGLAIIGACGDLQEKKHCKLVGLNQTIVEDGIKAGVLLKHMDIRYFGRETRSIIKLLQFSSDPMLPSLSGRKDACKKFLEELDIRHTNNDEQRKWIDLEQYEKQKIISALGTLLLTKGFGHKNTKRLIGEVYLLKHEQLGTELHEAKEFATLLNATARYGKYKVGFNVCLGDREKALEQARNLLRGHRQNIVEGMQVVKDEKIQKRTWLQFFHAGTGIRDTIVGIVTNMMLHSEGVDSSLPLIGFAETENGDIKVSARTTQDLVDHGINLSKALKIAAEPFQGIGGGHSIAAGATIPKGSEEEFLTCLEKELASQLSC